MSLRVHKPRRSKDKVPSIQKQIDAVSVALSIKIKERMAEQELIFQPQPGPQEVFLSTDADIAMYGGAAGGGKTYALLLENLRHVGNPRFGSVIFRRETPQITNTGGLWDNAMELYPLRGATPSSSPHHVMRFPSGARVEFKHLQHEKNVLDYQGAQIPLICFDELTHFTRKQFFYLLSRNRSTCGVKPYIRATTNPDSDSWVAEFIAWWIDQKTGYPIPERSGVVRYFVVVDDVPRWGDDRDALAAEFKMKPELVKSFTFIASSVYDNRILLEKDPSYLANLNALNLVEKERLLRGNWKIKPSAGLYFKRDQVQVVREAPSPIVAICRAWDLAATPPTPENPSPDATAGVKIARMEDGRYIVMNARKGRWASNEVRIQVSSTATTDRQQHAFIKVRLPQDPGQAGKEQAQSYMTLLAGHDVKIKPVTGDKIVRANPFSAQWQAGNVLILEGDWNEDFFAELEMFPDGHDDQVDASSDAFNEVAINQVPVVEAETVSYDQILNQTMEVESPWSMFQQ